MYNKDGLNARLIYIVLGILAAFIVVRFLPLIVGAFWRLLGPILLASAIVAGAIWAFRQARARAQRKAFARTAEGRIEAKLEQFRALAQKNRTEIEDIQRNIDELSLKLKHSFGLSQHVRQESEELLRAFESELRLRQTKTAFFGSAIRKLEILLRNQRLARELEEKKSRLRQLRDDHFEELARLESMKSDLELDVGYLETIDELSGRLLRSASADDAEHVRLELETMTRELDEF
jgi:hypothetical protein